MGELSPFLRTDHKLVDKHDPLHAVKSWLTGDSSKPPVVTDDGKPFGIVNERALMSRTLDLDAHVHRFTLPTRALPSDASIEHARGRLAEFRAAYLPVADAKGKAAGYVRALDIARQGLGEQRARDVAVPVTTLREGSTLGEALNAFAKEYVEYLPVLGDGGRVDAVLPRSEVLRVEFHDTDKGRLDAGGERRTLFREPVGGFVEHVPGFVAADAAAESVLDDLEERGYALVARPGMGVAVVTPETLFRGPA